MAHLLEIATASLLPVHHVMKDWDHDIPQIGLGHQRHLQERPNHGWDKVQLVFPCIQDKVQGMGQTFQLLVNFWT